MEQEPKIPTQGEETPGEPADFVQRDVSREVSILESLLLVSLQPLSFDRIGQLLGNRSKQDVREVVRAIQAKYAAQESGILVEEVAKGLQLRTNPANQEYVRKLFDTKPPRFTRPSLETLAVVAYNQPVTRLEIEQIRGVDCAASLKTLMERRLVKVVGKKDVPGRPYLFGTTREFLEVFSLSGLSELPSMRDIEDFLAARTGTPVPPQPQPAAPQLFAGFGGQAGAGEELAAELEESEHGDLLLSTRSVLPEGVSDDVLVEGASRTGFDTSEMKPLTPSGRGSSQFAFAADHLSFDPAEPLLPPSSDPQEVGDHEEEDPPEE
jgi:segregation and condensation protein B